MAHALTAFSDMIPGYPEEAPQSGVDLLAADPQSLPQLAKDLRRHFTGAVKSAGELTFAGADETRRRLELGHVLPLARKWVTMCLNADKSRVMVPAVQFSGMVAQRVVTKRVPSAEQLHRQAQLPDGGRYLTIYGGGPQILSVRDKFGSGVAEDIARLFAEVPVADIVFWHLEPGQAPTYYSLIGGIGDQAGQTRDFPDAHWLTVARGGVQTNPTTHGGTS